MVKITICHVEVPRFKFGYTSVQFPAHVHPLRQQLIANVVGSLPPVRETWIEFPATGFNLTVPQSLWAFGERNSALAISLCLALCISDSEILQNTQINNLKFCHNISKVDKVTMSTEELDFIHPPQTLVLNDELYLRKTNIVLS